MPHYQVIVKRIVSSDVKMISKTKSIAAVFSNGKGETNQSISLTVICNKISSSSSTQAKVLQ
jgi:hypothetical protein